MATWLIQSISCYVCESFSRTQGVLHNLCTSGSWVTEPWSKSPSRSIGSLMNLEYRWSAGTASKQLHFHHPIALHLNHPIALHCNHLTALHYNRPITLHCNHPTALHWNNPIAQHCNQPITLYWKQVNSLRNNHLISLQCKHPKANAHNCVELKSFKCTALQGTRVHWASEQSCTTLQTVQSVSRQTFMILELKTYLQKCPPLLNLCKVCIHKCPDFPFFFLFFFLHI